MWDFNAVYEEYAECAAPFLMETEEDEEREFLQSIRMEGIEVIA